MVNSNGFEYVDLGLPSGTLWATMNVGASKPSDNGLYFQWGDTQGYTKEQAEKDKKFFWPDYKWYESGNILEDNIVLKKYTTEGATLDLEDDAAHVHMGGDWHMPSPEQYQELIDNTISKYKKTQNGVNGILFTSKKDKSKTIFIPAAGTVWDGMVSFIGDNGYIWSSMMSTDSINCGKYLYFNSKKVCLSSTYLSDGLPVRGVIDKNDDNSKDKKKYMNEKVNLVEILKNVPKGTRLWSPVIGDCTFVEIDENNKIDEDKKIGEGEESYPIRCATLNENDDWTFGSDGSFTNYDSAECVLFPSKENRDWSTFKASKGHKHFEPYQKVLIKDKFCSKYFWVAALYSHFDTSTNKHYLVGADWAEDDDIISYEGNEDKLGKVIQ